MRKQILSSCLAGVLAISLCPGLASAQPVQATSAKPTTAAQAQVQPQANKTIYVVTNRKAINKSNGKTSGTLTRAYSYNSKGLVTKRVDKAGLPKSTYYWTYKNNSISQLKTVNEKIVFKLNKKGLKTSGTWTMLGGSSDKVVESYSYSGSNVKKIKLTTYWTDSRTGKKQSSSRNSQFTYKNGLPVKAVQSSGNWTEATTYSYDARGNLKKRGIKNKYYSNTYSYKNTYSGGRLTKSTIRAAGSTSEEIVTYTYKKMTVPASLAKKVQAQQWAIQNADPTYTFGGQMLH